MFKEICSVYSLWLQCIYIYIISYYIFVYIACVYIVCMIPCQCKYIYIHYQFENVGFQTLNKRRCPWGGAPLGQYLFCVTTLTPRRPRFSKVFTSLGVVFAAQDASFLVTTRMTCFTLFFCDRGSRPKPSFAKNATVTGRGFHHPKYHPPFLELKTSIHKNDPIKPGHSHREGVFPLLSFSCWWQNLDRLHWLYEQLSNWDAERFGDFRIWANTRGFCPKQAGYSGEVEVESQRLCKMWPKWLPNVFS